MHCQHAMIGILCILQFFIIDAYPTINMQRLFGYPAVGEGVAFGGGRYKKSDDVALPRQIDDDVLELEHLREESVNEDTPDDVLLHDLQQQEPSLSSSNEKLPTLLPDLEHQLEEAAAADAVENRETSSNSNQNEERIKQEKELIGAHRSPMAPQNGGAKFEGHTPSHAEETSVAPIIAKPFYGAARLAFGQNPEVLPTLSTTTTTTSSTTAAPTTTSTSEAAATAGAQGVIVEHTTDVQHNEPVDMAPDTALPTAAGGFLPSHPHHPPTGENGNNDNTKETIGDMVQHELEGVKTAARRSAPLMSPKTAESLLRRNGNGQISSFDMAQYVFWTGDEAGVARAVEEFIDQGLMTSENALKFLRDIRLGIDYLQRNYENRVFPDEIKANHIKKSYSTPKLSTTPPTTTTSSTTTTTTTASTVERPLAYVQLQRAVNQLNNGHLSKTIDNMALWNKLQDLNENNEQSELPGEYNEVTGRAKIVEFLYNEYTLEEILYKLAKVMFTQSLALGSNEAQHELQKLTDFLEREGNLGVISIDLQKKVLHVLLQALSDTLNEHPELLPAARSNLVPTYQRLPLPAYMATIN